MRERRAPNVTAPRPPALSAAATVRRQLLVLVGIVSFFAYWNFGAFHFGNYVHYWDSYHYYVGSKYFKELSFDLLYECSSIADSEEPSMRRKVELRKIMNLRTNVLGGTAEILANPDHCKKHFTPERWQMFKKDIEYFRNRHGVKRWEEVTTDHGYNATPVWTILGQALANLTPASDGQMWFLTRIDPMLILGMIAMIWWAFGWQVLCVGLAVFATNFPSRFYWTGGSYLRWDWLFHMTAGVCLIKKGKPIFGGYLVAYSALLRVFPGFMFLGPIFIVIQQLLDQTKGRKWWQRLPAHRAAGHVAQGGAQPPVGDPRRGAGGWYAGAGQPGDQQRGGGISNLPAEQQEAHVDAAHQLHGMAHCRHVQGKRGGALPAD